MVTTTVGAKAFIPTKLREGERAGNTFERWSQRYKAAEPQDRVTQSVRRSKKSKREIREARVREWSAWKNILTERAFTGVQTVELFTSHKIVKKRAHFFSLCKFYNPNKNKTTQKSKKKTLYIFFSIVRTQNFFSCFFFACFKCFS